MRLARTFALVLAVAVLAQAAGCSGSSGGGEPHQVKDLKSRGLKPDAADAKPDVPAGK